MPFVVKRKKKWQTAVEAQNIDITFHDVDLLAISDDDFHKYIEYTVDHAWYIP